MVDKLRGYRFESCCCHLVFRCRACFEEGNIQAIAEGRFTPNAYKVTQRILVIFHYLNVHILKFKICQAIFSNRGNKCSFVNIHTVVYLMGLTFVGIRLQDAYLCRFVKVFLLNYMVILTVSILQYIIFQYKFTIFQH